MGGVDDAFHLANADRRSMTAAVAECWLILLPLLRLGVLILILSLCTVNADFSSKSCTEKRLQDREHSFRESCWPWEYRRGKWDFRQDLMAGVVLQLLWLHYAKDWQRACGDVLAELGSCVKVEVAAQGSPFLIVCTVVKQHSTWTCSCLQFHLEVVERKVAKRCPWLCP